MIHVFLAFWMASPFGAPNPEVPTPPAKEIALSAPAGAPLRVYLTKRLPVRLGEPVQATLLDPVYAFDRIVLPAGARLNGNVTQLEPCPRFKRAMAILSGDLTSHSIPEVRFGSILLPDGKRVTVSTVETVGLDSVYAPPKPPKARKAAHKDSVVWTTARQQVDAKINQQIGARTRGIGDIARGPDKRQRLEDFLWRKLPYHPQWVRKGTRYDAPLAAPLAFGAAAIPLSDLQWVGTPPPAESFAHLRMLVDIDSAKAHKGDSVEAQVAEPLFSADRHLIFPEGTRMTGVVTQSRASRRFHRGGQLRFRFETIQPPEAAILKQAAQLAAVEKGGPANLKVDDEGGVKAAESKKRFIAPAVSCVIAMKSADNDAGKVGGNNANVSGRTLGGASGFGMAGALASQASRYVGTALGFYGLGWSVYNTVVARGQEVEFRKNASLDVRFGGRTEGKEKLSRK